MTAKEAVKPAVDKELAADVVVPTPTQAPQEAQTPEELWLVDLEAFVENYETFTRARIASREAAAAGSGAAAAGGKVKAGGKKAKAG